MARINGIDIEKVKAERIKKGKAQERELKRMRKESENIDSVKKEYKHAANILDIYDSLSDDEKRAFDKQVQKKEIRNKYIKYLKWVYDKNYVLTKFHIALANVCQSIVQKVENGENIIVLLSVPPQFGKSKTVTECLPSWFVMKNPDKSAILISYNADFAEKFGDSNRQKIKNFGKDLFGLEISDSQDNKTLFQIKKHEGQVLSTGIFGTITGNPASILIIDDPYKSHLEANNPDYREKVYSVVKSAAETRLNPMGSALIIIHTRWHEDDLIGRYLKENSDVIYINCPCVWESDMGVDRLLHRKVGEILSPELGHTAEWVERKRKSLGRMFFNALYQGRPFVEGGNIVKREFIKFYNKNTLPNNFEELTLSCDLTFGGTKTNNDPYCMTLWGRNGGEHYLLKIWDKKASFTDTLRTIRIICNEYPTLRRKLVERKANGQATIDMLGKEIGGFTPYDPKNTSKEDRLSSVVPYFEGGNVYFPCEEMMPNIEDYIEQLLKFPNATHDDFVDTISQYLLNYEYRCGGKILTDNSYSQISDILRGIKV